MRTIKPIELVTEEPTTKRHVWQLYWCHLTDMDANYKADIDTLAQAIANMEEQDFAHIMDRITTLRGEKK